MSLEAIKEIMIETIKTFVTIQQLKKSMTPKTLKHEWNDNLINFTVPFLAFLSPPKKLICGQQVATTKFHFRVFESIKYEEFFFHVFFFNFSSLSNTDKSLDHCQTVKWVA